jgi:hypothetical protein
MLLDVYLFSILFTLYYRLKEALQKEYAAGNLSLEEFTDEASRLPETESFHGPEEEDDQEDLAGDGDNDEDEQEQFEWPYDESDWKFSSTDLQRNAQFIHSISSNTLYKNHMLK